MTEIGEVSDLNPIIFLNTYARIFDIKDRFEYRYRLYNNKFICNLKFKDNNWESIEKLGKKQAKEDVARIAINHYLKIQEPEKYEQVDKFLRTVKTIESNPAVGKKVLTEIEISKIGKNLNPIIFLNTYILKFKIKDNPQYKYKSYNDKFICSLKFKDQYWESVEKPGRKQAKNDVARIAIDYLVDQEPEKCARIDKLLRTAEDNRPKKNIQSNTDTKVTSTEVPLTQVLPSVSPLPALPAPIPSSAMHKSRIVSDKRKENLKRQPIPSSTMHKSRIVLNEKNLERHQRHLKYRNRYRKHKNKWRKWKTRSFL
jgi:hypothetical protein